MQMVLSGENILWHQDSGNEDGPESPWTEVEGKPSIPVYILDAACSESGQALIR